MPKAVTVINAVVPKGGTRPTITVKITPNPVRIKRPELRRIKQKIKRNKTANATGARGSGTINYQRKRCLTASFALQIVTN